MQNVEVDLHESTNFEARKLICIFINVFTIGFEDFKSFFQGVEVFFRINKIFIKLIQVFCFRKIIFTSFTGAEKVELI